jgi:anhydro-N-acetylmuramic acid kinase
LVTGGGAHNRFLIQSLQQKLESLGISLIIPDEKLIDYKEALVMCLIGTLRWRGEANVLASVTGAARNSVGGAVWEGNE